MKPAALFLALGLAAASATSAPAWWDAGHMQIAALAWERLDEPVRAKVDALLRVNAEQYRLWSAGAPDEATGRQYAFIRASVWADEIKDTPGYDARDDKVDGPEAGRNIGWGDKLPHAYWHFKDIGFSEDGTPAVHADPVDAASQIKLLSAALAPGSGATDDVRSYDLVWLIHLVADAHQPLHAVARSSVLRPGGDAGGNFVDVQPATGEIIPLHAYWDRLLGTGSTPRQAVKDALGRDPAGTDPKRVRPSASVLPGADRARAAVADPDAWFAESAALARRYAYAEPVRSGEGPIRLDRAYETAARSVARQQASVAGARLANLINAALR